MMRSLIAIACVAAGGLLGAATTIGLNQVRYLLGPMAMDVSPFLNGAALAAAMALLAAGRVLHPASVRTQGHLLWLCALVALVQVGLNAWDYPVDDGAYYLLKGGAQSGGADGLDVPSLYAHLLAFALGGAGLYTGLVWSLSSHRLFIRCAMLGWSALSRRAAVAVASTALTGTLGAFYVGWVTALQTGFAPATHGQALAAAALASGGVVLVVLHAWRASLRRLSLLATVAGLVWLWAMATTVAGYLSVIPWK